MISMQIYIFSEKNLKRKTFSQKVCVMLTKDALYSRFSVNFEQFFGM